MHHIGSTNVTLQNLRKPLYSDYHLKDLKKEYRQPKTYIPTKKYHLKAVQHYEA